MKLFLVILPFLAMSVAYKDLDNNYFKKLIENKETFRLYLGCFVDNNPCDDFANHAKAHITESLLDSCNECDDGQKHIVHTIIRAMKTDFPELYAAFEDKYDPDRTLLAKLDEKIKKY